MVYLIQISIENGFSTCHLLWGEREYKTRFLAKPQQMNFYIVHRSYTLNYFISKAKVMFLDVLTQVKLSKYATPLKNTIKNTIKKIRKNSTQLSKIKYVL